MTVWESRFSQKFNNAYIIFNPGSVHHQNPWTKAFCISEWLSSSWKCQKIKNMVWRNPALRPTRMELWLFYSILDNMNNVNSSFWKCFKKKNLKCNLIFTSFIFLCNFWPLFTDRREESHILIITLWSWSVELI